MEKNRGYFLRVIPNNWRIYSGNLFGIPSDLYSEHLFDISSDILCCILSGIYFDRLSDIHLFWQPIWHSIWQYPDSLSDIFWHIFWHYFGILPDISSDILSDVSSEILCGQRPAGIALIQRLPLHCDLDLAVEVRRGRRSRRRRRRGRSRADIKPNNSHLTGGEIPLGQDESGCHKMR